MRARLTALAILLAAPAAAAPVLGLERTVHDFGTVEGGTRVEYTFALPNRGDALLQIEKVRGSCDCTVAVVSAREISPGGEARVAVTLDTSRLVGRTTKVLNLYTNDPARPVTPLALTGLVTTDLVVSPNPLYLGRVRRGDATRHELMVTSGGAAIPQRVTSVEHLHANLRAQLVEGDASGQRVVIELAPHVPLGRFSERLRLKTTSPRQPELDVTVFGSVEGDVAVLPPQVTFGITRRNRSPERELVIRNRGARRLAVTRIVVPSDLVDYTLEPLHEGEEYRLLLRLRSGLPVGRVEGAVEIFTNHPDESRLVVPLYAIVRAGSGDVPAPRPARRRVARGRR
jgi:hypothetical protein